MLNPYLRRGLLFSAPLVLTLAMSISVSAQQTGGDATGGQTGTGGTATATDTGIGGGGTGAFGTLDADTIFSGIERGEAVGSTGSTGTGFSGVDANAGGGRAGGIGGFGGGGLGGLGALFGLGNAGAGSQTTRPAIRTRLRSAINVQLTSPAVVQQVATQRLRSLSSQPQLRGINVSMQGKTAVISGVVRTDRDRRMSELLMRLEPGVGSVNNQVIVMPQ
jgi:hypothetical protein